MHAGPCSIFVLYLIMFLFFIQWHKMFQIKKLQKKFKGSETQKKDVAALMGMTKLKIDKIILLEVV